MPVNRRMGHARLLCQCFVSGFSEARRSASAGLPELLRTSMGGGNGAWVSPRPRAARAARGAARRGKVAFGVLGLSFSLPAGDASPLAASFAGASVVSACSRRPVGAGVAGGGRARAGQAGRYAAVRARGSAAGIRGAVRAGPRAGRASGPGAADIACSPRAAAGEAGSSRAIGPGPPAGDRTGFS